MNAKSAQDRISVTAVKPIAANEAPIRSAAGIARIAHHDSTSPSASMIATKANA
jgi:hypothetical protein